MSNEEVVPVPVPEIKVNPVVFRYVYRKHNDFTGNWSEWEIVKSAHLGIETAGDHLEEIRRKIAQGKPYQLKALYEEATPAQ